MAVAIARYYFSSGTTVVAPLLNLTKSGSGSDAIYKVAVAHLCCSTDISILKNLALNFFLKNVVKEKT